MSQLSLRQQGYNLGSTEAQACAGGLVACSTQLGKMRITQQDKKQCALELVITTGSSSSSSSSSCWRRFGAAAGVAAAGVAAAGVAAAGVAASAGGGGAAAATFPHERLERRVLCEYLLVLVACIVHLVLVALALLYRLDL
jgi:hypothetical protein